MHNFRPQSISPTVTIHISGSLSEGHLAYLDELTASAIDCALWPLLSLKYLEHLGALEYLIAGEGRNFGIVCCPNFIRERMQHEKERCAA